MKKIIQIFVCLILLHDVQADQQINSTIDFSSVEAVDLRTIFKMPAGKQGLEFSSKFLSLNERLVQISGYMVKTDEPVQGNFLIAVRPVQLNVEDEGDANDLPASTVRVILAPEQSKLIVPYEAGVHTFRGTLKIGRQSFAGQYVSWISLQLPPINQ